MGLPLATLPLYPIARAAGTVPPLPFTYTFGVIGVCNSRCLTCKIRNDRKAPDLSVDEWQQVFDSLGSSPMWVTLTGGEPFMRAELPELHRRLVQTCRPKIVNIPTNSLTTRTRDYVWEMAHAFPDTRLVINVSMDHCDPAKNDAIRGIPGHFKRAMTTFRELRQFGLKNLTVGIHTVISRFNVHDFPEIADFFLDLAPDQFISEVAEERIEMRNHGGNITPSPEEYADAIRALQVKMKRSSWGGFSKVTRAFRLRYYDLVIKHLETRKQAIPCFAGYASAQIDYEGTVWPCCVEAVPLGNLREIGYNFGVIWRGGLAKQARERIRTGGCACPLANASYSNMLFDPASVAKVAMKAVSR